MSPTLLLQNRPDECGPGLNNSGLRKLCKAIANVYFEVAEAHLVASVRRVVCQRFAFLLAALLLEVLPQFRVALAAPGIEPAWVVLLVVQVGAAVGEDCGEGGVQIRSQLAVGMRE